MLGSIEATGEISWVAQIRHLDLREEAMKQTNVRAVLYGRSNRLKEVLAENSAADAGEARPAARPTRRPAEADAPIPSDYLTGKLQMAD
jgi:hypothetical protein